MNVTRTVEWTLNGASIVLVVFLAGSLAVRHFSKAVTAPDSLLKLGTVISVPDVDWREAKHTLVLALSTTCEFCSESAPFYRALLQRADEGQWRAVVVMPQSVAAATAYMRAHGYLISAVRQVDLSALHISGTPSLLMVGSDGRLQQQWIGRLSAAEEADVARHLGVRNWRREDAQTQERPRGPTSAEPSPFVTADELLTLVTRDSGTNLVDVRDRRQYAGERIDSFVNIPAAELSVRAPHELLFDRPTVLYCNFQPGCAAAGIPSLCSRAAEELREMGAGNVRVVRDPLMLLAVAGVPVARAPEQQ